MARDPAPAKTPPETLVSRLRAWLAGSPLSPRAHLLIGLVAPAIVVAANMWRVRSFTIDDAYISFRYAQNFANGLGLVYNEGERIEGYTNFLWTVILGGGVRLGLDPDALSKVLGALSAFGALGCTYLLAGRLRPLTVAPCIATWLLASTVVFSGYAVFGLETTFFVALVLLGTWLFLREEERMSPDDPDAGKGRMPWSAVAFGLAGLTRPEAPMFIGILMLALGRGIFARRNLLRGVIFTAPIVAHALFRRAYYGTWLPNTLSAKTGDLDSQIAAGRGYVEGYARGAGPVLWLLVFALALALVERRRVVLAIAALAAAVPAYTTLVGGDWMPFFRFMSPFEPFAFLLIGLGLRTVIERRDRSANVAVALFLLAVGVQRAGTMLDAEAVILKKEKRFWDAAAGGTAKWLLEHGEPGEIAIGDIGYVGYATGYPVLDLLGLVDPVIGSLPGAYTRKLGPGFTDRFFDKAPRYALIISSKVDCAHPSVPNSQVIYRDPRFRARYEVRGKVPLDAGFAWCIFEKRAEPAPSP